MWEGARERERGGILIICLNSRQQVEAAELSCIACDLREPQPVVRKREIVSRYSGTPVVGGRSMPWYQRLSARPASPPGTAGRLDRADRADRGLLGCWVGPRRLYRG